MSGGSRACSGCCPAASRLSSVAASEGHSLLRGPGLSLQSILLLQSTGSRHSGSLVGAHTLGCSVACGPGIKPLSPLLTGRFLSTIPPGKSSPQIFIEDLLCPGHSLDTSLEYPLDKQSNKNSKLPAETETWWKLNNFC